MRDRTTDVRTVARELGVAHVLSGSLRRGGQRVRVTVQLTSARDGLVRWGESYEREVKDVFQVQEEIGRSIAGELEVAFDSGRASVRPATGDMDAYDLYLRGRFHWRQRGEESLRRAAEYFQQAIARDSGFARAWAGLADAVGLLPVYGPTTADSVLPIVEHAAARALALDGTLAEAHAARGQLYKSLGRWSDAEAAFLRAAAADSSYPSTFQWQGELYASLGRAEEAVRAMERARALDPMAPIINGELSYIRALEHEARAGRASPATVGIGLVGIGENAAAIAWLERALAAKDGMLYATPLNAPWYAPLWSEPGFVRLRQAMNLAELTPPPSR
jgi:serine/threonine-protein kinase